MPKWPFASQPASLLARQKVKVECATKLRTELAPPLYIGPLWAPSQSSNPSPSPVPGQARRGDERGLLVGQCVHIGAHSACNSGKQNFYYHRIFGLCFLPETRTKRRLVGLLPKDRNANGRDKQVEHFVRQRAGRV